MADLEHVNFVPMLYDPELGDCVPRGGTSEGKVPQLFWSDGRPWMAACEFALSKLRDSKKDKKTVISVLSHLKNYASWLEDNEIDWRDFPTRKRDRCLFKYRGFLVEQRDAGFLAPSTTTTRMASVIQFYRWARTYGWIERNNMWEDQTKAFRFHDTVGLSRTMAVLSSELAIPNNKRRSLTLEDGLLPLALENRDVLLKFLAGHNMTELFLMFLLGFFTGARSETIRTLRISGLANAIDDPSHPGVKLLAIGPGTGVKTKFDVSGQLKIPEPVINALEQYMYSPRRAIRQTRANHDVQSFLFLTERGNPYSETSFTKLISRLREKLSEKHLNQFREFKFHQSRATFGTQLMTIALESLPSQVEAICFVRDALFHKDESTTWKYIRFLEQAPLSEKLSKEFFGLFTGSIGSEDMQTLIDQVTYG